MRKFFLAEGFHFPISTPVEVRTFLADSDLPLPFQRPLSQSSKSSSIPEGHDDPTVGDLINLHPTSEDADLDDSPPLTSLELNALFEPEDPMPLPDFDIKEEVQRFTDRGIFPS